MLALLRGPEVCEKAWMIWQSLAAGAITTLAEEPQLHCGEDILDGGAIFEIKATHTQPFYYDSTWSKKGRHWCYTARAGDVQTESMHLKYAMKSNPLYTHCVLRRPRCTAHWVSFLPIFWPQKPSSEVLKSWNFGKTMTTVCGFIGHLGYVLATLCVFATHTPTLLLDIGEEMEFSTCVL